MAFGKLNRHKFTGIDEIQAQLIIVGGRTVLSEITQHLNSIRKYEKKLEEWKESIIVPTSKKGDKTDCNNYRAISYLSITYIILPNILLSR
jgi:hypothetical protein